jgi:hypothetical protein
MTVLTEGLHTGEFVLSLAPGYRSRENVVVASGQNLGPGTVLGRTGAASATAVANSGNTGNGTITLDSTTPLVAGIREGAYRLTFIEPASNLGTYEVVGPDGVALGTAVVGATFNNQLKFVVNDGSTDFVSGDGFVLYVRAGTVTPGTNTGNGTFTLYGTGEGAQVGSYAVAVTVAASNAGTFTVTAPTSCSPTARPTSSSATAGRSPAPAARSRRGTRPPPTARAGTPTGSCSPPSTPPRATSAASPSRATPR